MIYIVAADAPSWTDQGAFWVALAAAFLSLAALGVSAWAAVSGHRSANHAETSAEAAKSSATSSETAARAAEKSADADGKVAQVELDRDHERYRPLPNHLRFNAENRGHGEGRRAVFLELVLPRTYRGSAALVHFDGIHTSTMTTSITPAGLLEMGRQVRIWVGDTGENLPTEVLMHFWPPHRDGPGLPWECRCGGTLDDEDGPHWEWRISVPPRDQLLGATGD